MWTIETLWFEIAMVNALFAIGNICLGHFEEKTPKLKRLGKYLITLMIVVSLSYFLGRTIAMMAIGLSLLPALYIHTIALPKNGVNGWTAEPKGNYYELRGWTDQENKS